MEYDTRGPRGYEPKAHSEPRGSTNAVPKKKTAKRQKKLAGAPGDAEKEEENELTIAQCVKMDKLEIKKLSPKSLKVMKTLYVNVFDPLYVWGKKSIADLFGVPLRIHFDYLHQAPIASLVYRGIEEQRLKSMINKAQLESDYDSEFRIITVFPLKFGPYGPNKKASCYDV